MGRIIARKQRESNDSGLGSSPPARNDTIDHQTADPSSTEVSDDTFLLTCLSKNEQDAVLYKLDSSTFNKLRKSGRCFGHIVTTRRWRYPVRQPIYQLELTEEKIVYLTGAKTRKTIPFNLNEKNKYELLKVEPEYITVYGHIFGSETKNLMKKPSPMESTRTWKDLCRFVMSQFGLNFDSDGNVMDDSEIPKYVSRLDFGANQFPIDLVQKYLKSWSQEKCPRGLSTLEVSFKERLQDKSTSAEELLSGLKFEKVWAPSSHERSVFDNAILWEYEKRLLTEYSLSAESDPVLMYATLSNDGERMAVLGISDYAMKLSFCKVGNDGAYLELRGMFMEITESDDYSSVSEWKLKKLLERLRK